MSDPGLIRMSKAVEAIRRIAAQKLPSEMDENEQQNADYEGAYEAIVSLARSWISPMPAIPLSVYDKTRDLMEENERLRAALEAINWKSIDKDNMEFEARIDCYQMDKIRAVLS